MAKQSLGTLYIVAAPSGGGKTSLVKELLASLDGIEASISHTTRPKRPGEQEGVDYFFIDDSSFRRMVKNEEFIEHAKVFGNQYGTSKEQIQSRLDEGVDVLLDIDWQGAQQIKTLFENSVGVFIIPPSLEDLKQRLLARNQDNEQVIQDRMKQAQDELSHYTEFDYLIVNDQFEVALEELKTVIAANRLRVSKQTIRQSKLLSFLLERVIS